MPQMKIQHVALSVTDITKSGPWYEELFGFAKVAEFAEPAPMAIYMTPEGQALDLRQDPDVAHERFTEKRVGLDHLAFVCADKAELDEWTARIAELGIENTGPEVSPFGTHLNFRDPDGIPLEFFLPASA
ncbi:VOC family protein [Longivirga aurantiaca]|uniref:VOC family protein n=1 Tax=Longivirga aurantiaca TaxID=1837743 RepID=A0ABW1T6P3_9ACTN